MLIVSRSEWQQVENDWEFPLNLIVVTVDDQLFIGLDSHEDCVSACESVVRKSEYANAFLVCAHGIVYEGSPVVGPTCRVKYLRPVGTALTAAGEVGMKRLLAQLIGPDTHVIPSLGVSEDLRVWIENGLPIRGRVVVPGPHPGGLK